MLKKKAGALRKRADEPGWAIFRNPVEPGDQRRSPAGERALPPPLIFWMALDILRNAGLAALGTILWPPRFFYLGSKVVKPKFTASAQLLRSGTPEFFQSVSTHARDVFRTVYQSRSCIAELGSSAKPPLPPETLIKCIKIEPEPDSDLRKVCWLRRTKEQAVNLLNTYLRQSVAFTKELDEQANQGCTRFLKTAGTKMNEDITSLHEEFRGKAGASPLAG